MMLQRQTNRRLQQQKYRKELYDEIKTKQTLQNKRSPAAGHGPDQQFSLLSKIEEEEQRRRNLQKQYYQELEKQRQEVLQEKKRRKIQQQEQEQRENQKIERESQALRQRYHDEIRKQQEPQSTHSHPKDSLDALEDEAQASKNMEVTPKPYFQSNQVSLPLRTRTHESAALRELMTARMIFDEETKQMSQLNQMITSSSKKVSKSQASRGLLALKQLSGFLDEQYQNLRHTNVGKKTQMHRL